MHELKATSHQTTSIYRHPSRVQVKPNHQPNLTKHIQKSHNLHIYNLISIYIISNRKIQNTFKVGMTY